MANKRNGGNKRGGAPVVPLSTSYAAGVVVPVAVRPAVNPGPVGQSGRARGKAAAGKGRAARGLVRRASSSAVAGGGNASGRVWPRLGRATRVAARGAIGAAVAGALSAASVLVRMAGAMATTAAARLAKFDNIVTIGNGAAMTTATTRAARGRKGRAL